VTAPVRVLLVDDSAFARKVMREVLAADDRVEVVGTAHDGLDALEKIDALRPDVLTLDLLMPHLDGLGVLTALRGRAAPRVLVVTTTASESELALDALSLGAVDVLTKPTTLATHRLYELGRPLVEKVLAVAAAHPAAPGESVRPARAEPVAVTVGRASQVELVVVGTSTGGPQALGKLLAGLAADFPAPVVMGLHIPAEYTQALAGRLAQRTALSVVESSGATPLVPGRAVLAAGGRNLVIERTGAGLEARSTAAAGDELYVPSIDLLFASAARACGEHVAAVVLTGMGEDGLRGARAIVDAGGRVLTERDESCVVYGMPRAVHEAGLDVGQAHIDAMGATLLRLVRGY